MQLLRSPNQPSRHVYEALLWSTPSPPDLGDASDQPLALFTHAPSRTLENASICMHCVSRLHHNLRKHSAPFSGLGVVVSLGLDSVLHIEDPRSVLTKNQPVGNLLALTTYCQCTNFMEMESDHLDEMAAMNLGQDLHDSSTEQHGELSTRMSHVEDAGSLPHPSPYATSSLSAQPSGPCQESNDVEMAASPPSISDSITSIPQDLSSYPRRLWNARAIVTTSDPGENVQRCLLTSTTIPVNNLPSSDYPRMSEQIDHATNMYTEYDKDIEDDREHVNTYSDGVYLHSAAPESFIGIALPSSSPTNVLNASNSGEEIVISDDDDSEDDQTLAELSLQTPKRFPSVGPSSFQANYGAHVGQIQTRPARDRTTPRQQQGFTALSTPVPAPKGQEVLPRTSLRQSSVLRYSDVKEVGAKAEIADFDIVVTTRESSADPEVHTEPQADSAAATLTGIARSLDRHASAADMQQVKWLKWAKTQCGDKRTGGLWTKDTLLRDLKRQIQAKLRSRYFLAN